MEAELIKMHIQGMFNQWEKSKPLRTGLHASSVLVPEDQWCTRKHVLASLFPDEAIRPDSKPWDHRQNAIFLHGWMLHEKYQMLFSKFGDCVEVETPHYDESLDLWFTPDAIIRFGGETYVVEIKGYKAEEYEKHTDMPPRAAHIQANLYCYLLDIQKAIILIEHKGTQDFKVYVMERDYDLYEPYSLRVDDVKYNTLSVKKRGMSELSPRTCSSRYEPKARNCPLRDCCFSEKVEVKEHE